MAYLMAYGAEATAPTSGVLSLDNPASGSVTGTVTRDTSKQRSGGRGCYKFDSGAGNAAALLSTWSTGFTSGASKVMYVRSYFCFDALPGSTVKVLEVPGPVCSARLTSAGKLQLFNDSTGVQIGSDSAATIAADGATYYRVEVAVTLSVAGTQTAAVELRLDGVTVASTTGLALGIPGQVSLGWIAAPGANKVCYADDIKCNDSTGTKNNSWPGSGKVWLMLPVSDNNRGAWTAGAGGTTSLFDAVNNLTPVGVAEASATNTSQIKNRTTTNPTNCDFNLDTYTGAGLGVNDVVNACELFAAHGEDPATGTKAGTVTIVSNPAGSPGTSFNFGADLGLQGTYVGNWRWTTTGPGANTSIVEPTSVTIGTAPVVRITCTSGATAARSASCCFLGMIVEFTPVAPTSFPPVSLTRPTRYLM